MTSESIVPLINMDFDGLKSAIVDMAAGARVKVKTGGYSYNNENLLSSVFSIAYLGAMQYYYKPIREMPAGLEFADVIFIPKKASASLPAMVIELKWNKSADTALFQIKNKKYTCALSDYEGDILLVGISYDKRTKKHECKIEKIEK